jgi:magnesium-protoporphyrin IX monomethyl ester (oxidative) cyclase
VTAMRNGGTAANGTGRDLRVLLVNAPFGLIEYPHLGISLIKAVTRDAGFHCDVWYAAVEFAKMIGFAHYRAVENASSSVLLPERMFARALSPGVPSLDAYVDACLKHFRSTAQVFFGDLGLGRVNRQSLTRVEALAQRYVEGLAERRDLAAYDVVGFSSNFGQHVASLAMAQRLKALHPHLTICFGGANCEGPMGKQLVRSFPFVDYAFSGDGDVIFPLFLQRLAAGAPIDLPGVFTAADRSPVDEDYRPLTRMRLDDLPYPDFDDFFAAYEKAPEGKGIIRAIPAESARGCWWGEKHHCTFCGLNGMTMTYRSKSPQRFADEVTYLVRRYGVKNVMVTDNILDMRYIKEVVPRLRAQRAHDGIFYEVKSNLTREDLEALASAGITELQPGVESLSTHVLQLIDKGCTALQNVQLLKWGEEVGTTLVWTFLCGVPGETPEDYAEMVELMKKIPHLQPGRGFNRVSIHRFSPYFVRPERYGLEIYPAIAYRYIYDLPEDEVRHLAFWWSYDHANGSSRYTMEAPAYARAALHQRTIWTSQYGVVKFRYRVGEDGCVELEDTRSVATAEHVRLDALASAIFLIADRIVTPLFVRRELERLGWGEVSPEAIQRVLDDLEARFIVHREGDHYLALANRDTRHELQPFLLGGVSKGFMWREIESRG